MRLVSLQADDKERIGIPGVIIGAEVLNLCAEGLPGAAQPLPVSVRLLLEGGEAMLERVRRVVDKVADSASDAQRLRESGALLAYDRARLLAPIGDPGFILSCGMNYHAHLKEMNSPVPDEPLAFIKHSASIIGPGAPIVLPASNPDMVDWEGEFCAVIGRRCHKVSEAEALDVIAGYTFVNDVSARDWVAPIAKSQGVMGPIHAWDRNILGKQFPTFCPMGPALMTREEVPDPDDVAYRTLVNGQVMQSTHTSDLVFNVRQLIAFYSRFYEFRPGDVITLGSPSGVGYGRNPKIFLNAGDVVEVDGGRLGVLSNPVIRG